MQNKKHLKSLFKRRHTIYIVSFRVKILFVFLKGERKKLHLGMQFAILLNRAQHTVRF